MEETFRPKGAHRRVPSVSFFFLVFLFSFFFSFFFFLFQIFLFLFLSSTSVRRTVYVRIRLSDNSFTHTGLRVDEMPRRGVRCAMLWAVALTVFVVLKGCDTFPCFASSTAVLCLMLVLLRLRFRFDPDPVPDPDLAEHGPQRHPRAPRSSGNAHL